MKTLDMTRLYNWEIKEEYIKGFDGTNESKKTIYYNLSKAGKIEKEKKKDLYDMTVTELDDVFDAAGRTSENSVRAFMSSILSYIRWAEEKGYSSSSLPMFTAESMSSVAHKYVRKTTSKYYTQEELLNHYKKIDNKSDIAIIQCIFEGIKGQGYSEIFNLKAKDMCKKEDKFYVNLYDTEKGIERSDFEISEFLYELLLDVDISSTTIDTRGKELELIPSQYIFKKSAKGNKNYESGEKLTSSYISNKPVHYRKYFDEDNFNLKDIKNSGVMHFVYQLLKNREDKLVTFDDYKQIADRFNTGKYFHTFYEDERVNYTAIEGMIDIDFYEEHYGEIKLP